MVNAYNKVLDEDEVIPLTYDRVFKLIFGDPNHLERLNLLLSVTLKKKVEVIELYPNDLLDDNRINKKNEVDLLCKLDGEYVSIEVNTNLDEEIIYRNISFVSRVMSKALKPGEDYSKINKYYQINIDVEDFLGLPYEICHLKGDFSNKIANDRMEFYFINVKHFAKTCYNGSGKELTDFEKIYGMIGTNSKSVIDVLTKDNEILKDIGDMVKKYSGDDELLFYYDRDERMRNDVRRITTNELTEKFKEQLIATTEKVTEEVTKKVTKEVTKEVAEKTTLDMANKFKEAGVSIDIIANITGLSKDKVESL